MTPTQHNYARRLNSIVCFFKPFTTDKKKHARVHLESNLKLSERKCACKQNRRPLNDGP